MDTQARQLARILVDHTAEAKDPSKPVKDFVSFLAQEQLLGQWREIEREIHTIWKERFGASNVKVISAHDLTKETKEQIETIAKGADVDTAVDQRLIGGLVIRVDDQRIDGSLIGTLKRLKTQLNA